MIALWYGILAFMLATYLVLDGRNFGVGILHRVVARTPLERRQVIAALGPLWSWHEVWLVGFGGVLIMAFPRFMAAAFSGYYLALFLVLWCILLRGLSIEVGGHLNNKLWQSFWDVVFFGSNVLLAVLFGAALGNAVRGVPLKPDGTFYLTFFTDFRVTGEVGLLDWYTLSVAVFFTLVLTAHGATYLVMRTEGPVHERAKRWQVRLWFAAVPAFALISLLTHRVRPELFNQIFGRPLAWVTLGLAVVGALGLVSGLRSGREKRALAGSTFFLFGLIMTGAAALYPVFFFSTKDPNFQLLAAECAAPIGNLRIATYWWFPALALAVTYLLIIQRHYSGKVNVVQDNQGLY
jgi:cytochrome d ubiquinol oxidase subunit II